MNRKLSWSSWTFCTRQLSSLMAVAVKTAMTLKTYQNQAGLLVKDYLLSDPFVPYTSILGGILACKVVVPILCWNILEAWGNHSFVMMILVFFSFKCLIFSLSLFSMKVYDLTQLISAFYFRSYNSLTKMQRIEWNNRWTYFHFYIFILLVFCWLECFLLIIDLAEVFLPFTRFSLQVCPCTLCFGRIFSQINIFLAFLPAAVHFYQLLH